MFLDKRHPTVDEIETVCAKFKMSIGITELGPYLNPTMISCYERIQSGSLIFGTLFAKRNRHHHQNLESILQQNIAAKRQRNAEVEMGMAFNIQNMLGLFRSFRNIQLELEMTERNTNRLRMHLLTVRQYLHSVFVSIASLPYNNANTLIIEQLDQSMQDLDNIYTGLTVHELRPMLYFQV